MTGCWRLALLHLVYAAQPGSADYLASLPFSGALVWLRRISGALSGRDEQQHGALAVSCVMCARAAILHVTPH